jgi:putative hydrolase of the HAD superfamily
LSSAVRAFIFDFDDTISDSREAKANALRRVSSILKREMEADEDSLLELLAKTEEDMNSKISYDRCSWWKMVGGRLGVEVSTKLALCATVGYWTTFTKFQKPFADAEQVLLSLRSAGYLLGMVTDTDGTPGVKRWRISSSPLFKYFDAVVIAGEDTRHTKPDGKPYTLCIERLGVSAKDTVFVGDKPYTDIKGANGVGMRSILVKRREWLDADRPTYTVKSLSEIPAIFGIWKINTTRVREAKSR